MLIELQSCYRKVYDKMLADLSVGPGKSNTMCLSGFWPMLGIGYSAGAGTMIIGRATNGWSNCWRITDTSDNTARHSILNNIVKDSSESFSWMRIDEADSDGYNINRSALWRVVRKILCRLDNLPCQGDRRWTENLCWSNLMKIAPQKGGNPPKWLSKLQMDSCRELLRLEIELLRPRRVLLFTGEEWFEGFRDHLPVEMSRPRQASTYVKGVAKTVSCTWLLADHPMTRPEGHFVAEVMSELGFPE